MSITNQVPFITTVSVKMAKDYEESSIYYTKGYTSQI
jgi:hypothetical protein